MLLLFSASFLIFLSDSNNNNNNLATGLLILLNKIALVLLLLNLMFALKGNGSKHKKKSTSSGPYFPHLSHVTFFVCNFLCWIYILLITLSGDVEINLGPKRKAVRTLSICHWNSNSICAHNFAKSSLLRAYVNVHKFDIICFSETYLDSNIDGKSLEI